MRRLASTLGSKALTPYLLGAYATLLALLAAWGARVPGSGVASIARLSPFALIYVVGTIHLACCLWLHWPVVKWSALGTILFHAALLLLPAAWIVSRATRFQGSAWIVEGHPFRGSAAEYARFEPAGGFEERAPRVSFDVESVEADFWGSRLFFTDLRALVRLDDGGGSRAAWMRLPQPIRVDGARVNIRGFHYTPAVLVLDHAGKALHALDLSLRLFPPGSLDSFRLPGLPHRFFVRLFPDAEGPGSPVRGFALGKPMFELTITSGKRLVAHGWLRPGETLPFDGKRISFPAIRRGGEIMVHRDRGYPLLWMALGLGLLGSAIRLGFSSRAGPSHAA